MAAKKTTRRPAPKRGGALPEPAAREGSTDYNDFLKADVIGPEGTDAQIVFTGNVRGPEDSEFGERIIAEVTYKRKSYDFSIKTDSANYRLLFDRFGRNTAKWRGPVNVTIKHFANNDYVAVVRNQK